MKANIPCASCRRLRTEHRELLFPVAGVLQCPAPFLGLYKPLLALAH